jgi:hypothetical protein
MRQRRRVPWVVIGSIAAGAFVLGILRWSARPVQPDETSGVSMLAAAIGRIRPSEARLTGNWGYAPVARDGREAEGRQLTTDARLAIVQLAHRAGLDSSPGVQRALAASLVVEGRTDAAIEVLAGLVRRDPADVLSWTDLGAAYLTRARPEDSVYALDALERAVALRPDLAEARFNQGLAL